MDSVLSIDARTGETRRLPMPPTSEDDVRRAAQRAQAAFAWLSQVTRAERAALLSALADALEAHRGEIVAVADGETALGARLDGELTRATTQLRFFGQVLRDGAYLDVSIEHERTGGPLRQPDLRRWNAPTGPVAVFGASNFPLAFGAPGGDTASALAAGCPVVVKAHSLHPATTALVGRVFMAVLAERGAPEGVFQVVYGRAAGTALVSAPEITAVGFTGSERGGRALHDVVAARPAPIPFYGELGSVNPVVVLRGAARARGSEIGAGFADSMTIQAGQMCTKPGLLLVPCGAAGDAVVAAAAERLAGVAPVHLLGDATRESFLAGVAAAREKAAVVVAVAGDDDRTVGPSLVTIDATVLTAAVDSPLREEHFGPFGVIARYRTLDEALELLATLPPALTGTLHADVAGESSDAARVHAVLIGAAGRVVCNGWPTGVAVAWGMTHGGPYPATTSASTSVGASAIRRWLRPVTYQDAPAALLPAELRDDELSIPRRVDGILTTPPSEPA